MRMRSRCGADVLRIGLTGGVACGKSTVGAMLVEHGAHLLKADELSHELMQPGTAAYEQIVASFGREILAPDGAIDRKKLGALVFASEKPRIAELNAILHPAPI